MSDKTGRGDHKDKQFLGVFASNGRDGTVSLPNSANNQLEWTLQLEDVYMNRCVGRLRQVDLLLVGLCRRSRKSLGPTVANFPTAIIMRHNALQHDVTAVTKIECCDAFQQDMEIVVTTLQLPYNVTKYSTMSMSQVTIALQRSTSTHYFQLTLPCFTVILK